MSRFVTRTPVGIVRARHEHEAGARRDRLQDVLERELEIVAWRRVHDGAAARPRGDRIHVEGRRHHHELRRPPIHRLAAQRDQGGHQDAFVESVDEQQAFLGNSQVRRGLAVDDVVVGIARDIGGAERGQRLEHLRRAARGVFVEVQSQSVAGRRGAVVAFAHGTLTRMDASCETRPSARASVRTVGARRPRPARVTRWTDTTRTKSAVLSPPRNRAAPPVGST